MPRKSRSFARLPLDKLIAIRNQLQSAINAKVADERRQLEVRMNELAAVASDDTRLTASPIPNMSRAVRRGSQAKNGHAKHGLKGSRVPAKYRGPNGETWSGRGLPPRWLVALEKGGKKRDTFLIKR